MVVAKSLLLFQLGYSPKLVSWRSKFIKIWRNFIQTFNLIKRVSRLMATITDNFCFQWSLSLIVCVQSCLYELKKFHLCWSCSVYPFLFHFVLFILYYPSIVYYFTLDVLSMTEIKYFKVSINQIVIISIFLLSYCKPLKVGSYKLIINYSTNT